MTLACFGWGVRREIGQHGRQSLQQDQTPNDAALLSGYARAESPTTWSRLRSTNSRARRVADSGLAEEQHHAHFPGRGEGQLCVQLRDLGSPTDQSRRHLRIIRLGTHDEMWILPLHAGMEALTRRSGRWMQCRGCSDPANIPHEDEKREVVTGTDPEP